MTRPLAVVFGALTVDNVITADGEAMPPAYGGNVLYSALGARLWLEQVGVVSVRGEGYPDAAFEMLEARGIDAGGVTRVARPHDHNVAFAYRRDGSRTRSIPPELIAKLAPADRDRFLDTSVSGHGAEILGRTAPTGADLPKAWLGGVKAIHLASMPARNMLDIAQILRGAGSVAYVQINSPWLDNGASDTSGTGALLPLVDVAAPSEQDLENFRPGQPYEQTCGEILAQVRRAIVLKRSSAGSTLATRLGAPMNFSAFPVAAVDPTGAGDSFCGGLLAGMCLTGDLPTAIHMGTVSASFCVSGFGLTGLLGATAAEAEYRLAALAATTNTQLKI